MTTARDPDAIVLPNEMNPTTSAEASHSMALAEVEERRIEQANKTWGGGRDFSLQAVTTEALYWLQQASAALAEVARRVAWAHDVLGSADWKAWVARDLGISQRSAYNLRTIAQRLLSDGQDHAKVLQLGPSKVYELLSHFDDEQVEVLEQGGDVEDLNLDRFDDMSVREMKASLRKLKERKDQYLRRAQEAEKAAEDKSHELKEVVYGKTVRDELPHTVQSRWRNAELSLAALLGLLKNDIDLATADPVIYARACGVHEAMREWTREFDRVMDKASLDRARENAQTTDAVEIDGRVVQLSERALQFCARLWSMGGIVVGDEINAGEVWVGRWTPADHAAAVEELEAAGALLPLPNQMHEWRVRDPHDRIRDAVDRARHEELERTRAASVEQVKEEAKRKFAELAEASAEYRKPNPYPEYLPGQPKGRPLPSEDIEEPSGPTPPHLQVVLGD